MPHRPPTLTFVGGALALATTGWTVGSGVAPVSDAVTALLVPALFVDVDRVRVSAIGRES